MTTRGTVLLGQVLIARIRLTELSPTAELSHAKDKAMSRTLLSIAYKYVVLAL